jgi:hypothetical protein
MVECSKRSRFDERSRAVFLAIVKRNLQGNRCAAMAIRRTINSAHASRANGSFYQKSFVASTCGLGIMVHHTNSAPSLQKLSNQYKFCPSQHQFSASSACSNRARSFL